MRGRAAVIHPLVAGVLLLGACGAAGSPSEPADTPPAAEPAAATPAAEPAAATAVEPAPQSEVLTGAEIQAWVADTDWSFLSEGVDEPAMVSFTGGAATDEYLRTYSIGVGIEGDANSDGIADLVVPVTQIDGNGLLELWYVWLGTDGHGDAVARQVEFPIARSTRCGDVVHAIVAVDGGFSIDETLWLPEDIDRDCVSGGTGTQVREITIADAEGIAFPVQTAPEEGWGGVTPQPEWFADLP